MELLYSRTKTIQEDKVSGFCPGCMHSTVIKLIGEVLEELDVVDRTACVLGIGCCGLHMDYMAYDNITVFFINNANYGMTGGQMAPTTLMGMKTSTTPYGRTAQEHGYPMHMSEIINQLTAPYYIERVSCDTPQHVIAARRAIKKAFQYQMEGKGYSLVEIVTSCPTNWGLDTLKSLDFLREKMFAEYPLGVFRDGGEKKQ